MRACLESVEQQSYSPTQTLVIDNSGDPRFSEKVRASFSSIRIHSNPRNLYYGPSLNKGISLVQGEFVLCLNDDVFLDKEFIAEALNGFAVKDRIGMVSGKILRPDAKTLDSTGLFLTPWRTAGERGYGRPDSGQYERPGYIFGVSGAAAFYRRRMLDEVRQGEDYFDSRFHMFYEDLDVSWRARRCGWQGYYMPKAKAFHARGGSWRPEHGLGRPIARRYLDDRLHAELIKNRYLAVLKNESLPGLIMHFLPMALYDLCAWAYILLFQRRLIKMFLKIREDSRLRS